MSLQKLKRDGVALAYQASGTGEAAPMLFIHGWCCDHSYFAAQQAFFSKTRRTVAVDLRGQGASDAPLQDYTVATFVDDLAWLCGQLELAKPIVIGHSMGGTIALELAARHPDLVAAAVLIDSFLFLPPSLMENIRGAAAGLQAPDYMPLVEQIIEPLFAPSDDPSIRKTFLTSLAATPQHVLATSFASHLIDYDAVSAATACQVPIAYICTDTTAADVAAFQALCPQLKIGRTLGAGHFSPWLVPDQINAMIQGFERAYVHR
jgi:pimeloyl-ACP methyl ester carboxylesterase